MHTHIVFKAFRKVRGVRFRSFVICYCLGLILGSVLSYLFSYLWTPDLVVEILAKPSLFGLFFAAFIPFALIVYLIFFKFEIFSLLLLFTHSFCFGFVGAVISFVFGNSAWLIRPLVMFTCGFSLVCLWLLLICKDFFLHRKNLVALVSILFSATLIDRFLISKFLYNLIVFF